MTHHLQDEQDAGWHALNSLRRTSRGTTLKQLDPRDEYLTEARFAHSVIEVSKTKRKKGDAIRQAFERIIPKAP